MNRIKNLHTPTGDSMLDCLVYTAWKCPGILVSCHGRGSAHFFLSFSIKPLKDKGQLCSSPGTLDGWVAARERKAVGELYIVKPARLRLPLRY